MSSRASEQGFATLDILAATTVLAITLLSIATMFLSAQASVARSGDTTIAVGQGRYILESMRSAPFQSLSALDGLDTDDPSTLPPDEPERDLARRWRYAIAGEGDGWTYTTAEKATWPTSAEPGLITRGRIVVTEPTTSMRAVTVTLTVPGRAKDLELATLISRTKP